MPIFASLWVLFGIDSNDAFVHRSTLVFQAQTLDLVNSETTMADMGLQMKK
jgi:hypothetical protein